MIWKWGDGTANGSVIPPNTKCEHLVSVMDWVASVIDLAGGEIVYDQHYDSISILPLLFTEEPDELPAPRNFHFYSIGDYRGVRMNDDQGKWFYKRVNVDGIVELYDIINDLEQTTNLVDGHASISEIPDNHPHKRGLK